MRKVTLFYNDGTVVHGGGEDDEEVTITFSKKWLEAPADGLCLVNLETDDGTIVSKEWDHYMYHPLEGHGEGAIHGANDIGAYLRQYGIVKFGGWTSRANYQEMIVKARKDHWTPQTNEELEQLKKSKQNMD